jgi:NADH:ubiquinone reductase (H+-translocating)
MDGRTSIKRSALTVGAGALAGYGLARIYQACSSPYRLPGSGPHVVILGSGFGGLSAASKIRKLTGDRVQVSLIDQHNYHLFTPMLYEVATCAVVPYDVAIPLRSFATPRGIHFHKAKVVSINFEQQRAETDDGALGYDYLIIATDYFGNDSARQHAMPLKSLEGALAIRNQVLDALEKATSAQDEQSRRALLSFVVVGGGATAVETAGALADAVRHLIPKNYPSLNQRQARVILMEADSKLLGHMSSEMANIALRELRTAGVEVWLNARAKKVGLDTVSSILPASPAFAAS